MFKRLTFHLCIKYFSISKFKQKEGRKLKYCHCVDQHAFTNPVSFIQADHSVNHSSLDFKPLSFTISFVYLKPLFRLFLNSRLYFFLIYEHFVVTKAVSFN